MLGIEDQIGFRPQVDEEVEQLMKASVHMGHAKSKTHPSMRPFIFTTRNNVQIIDVLKTKEYLAKAETFLKSVAARNGTALWVGTRPSAKEALEAAAEATGMPYVAHRWVGGLLTNFKVIAKRAARIEEIEAGNASGDYEKYTKQERARINDEYQSLLKTYAGLRKLKRLPEALIIIDTTHDRIAVNEAQKVRIPIVALIDSNADLNAVQYPVPSNDDARLAVNYMMERFAAALKAGAEEAARAAAEALERERQAREAEAARAAETSAETAVNGEAKENVLS